VVCLFLKVGTFWELPFRRSVQERDGGTRLKKVTGEGRPLKNFPLQDFLIQDETSCQLPDFIPSLCQTL